jgi:hypothetical protein
VQKFKLREMATEALGPKQNEEVPSI